MATVSPDTSPAMLLDRVRGPVTNARPLYPERILIEITDAEGALWRLATCDAEHSPSDPDRLIGRTVVGTSLDEGGVVVLAFSDGTRFTATPVLDDEDDDIENWSLFTPDGRVLVYGPTGRWKLVSATDPC
jgi:hypothetical protein